jgi:hypothetical protein
MSSLCNATIGHHLARARPYFLNPYAILLGFYPGFGRRVSRERCGRLGSAQG